MDRKAEACLKITRLIRKGPITTVMIAFLTFLIRLIAPRKAVAEKNISIVFPEKSAEERKKILNESYRSMILTGVEMLACQREPKLIDEWTAEVEGREYIDAAYARGKGIIAVSAHIGNWEHGAAWVGRNARAYGIVQLSDSPFQRDFINALRVNAGWRIIPKNGSMTRSASLLKKNNMLGLASDQIAGGEGIKASFFGMNTLTFKGAAVFAYLTGAAIIPIQDIRLAPFRFKMLISPPIEWEKGPDKESTILNITNLVNKELEKMVLREPGQWLWQHRRFKDIVQY